MEEMLSSGLNGAWKHMKTHKNNELYITKDTIEKLLNIWNVKDNSQFELCGNSKIFRKRQNQKKKNHQQKSSMLQRKIEDFLPAHPVYYFKDCVHRQDDISPPVEASSCGGAEQRWCIYMFVWERIIYI